MQNLSTYLLEVQELTESQIASREEAISDAIAEWLSSKGVDDPQKDIGEFNSLTANGEGKFSREITIGAGGTLNEVRLEEFSKAGQTFTTNVSIVRLNTGISVLATLSVTNTVSSIAPVQTDPRCPSVVRKLLSSFSDWTLNGNPLGAGRARRITGEEGAQALLRQITSNERLLPIVVVSENDGEILWPRLDTELAFDLAGLAHVVTIDDEAAWVLSDEVGKNNSCYRGAVRLYWPVKAANSGANRFPGAIWTASALLSTDQDGRGLARIRAAMRRKIMSVAALTVVPPSSIREIKASASRARIAQLESRVDSNTVELELAKEYVADNENLRSELAKAQSEIATLSSRAEMAEYSLSQISVPEKEPDQSDDASPFESSPKTGETRFYKKTHSKSAYDVLVQVPDCGHSSWQNAAKADKAKKGVERLEGTDNWKSIHHCGSCTGGGMWRVRW